MGVGIHEDKLFKNEIGVFNQYKNFTKQEKSPEELHHAIDDLTNKYKTLLDQKLHRANRDLNEHNNKLEKTLAELVKATAGRNAFIIIYFIAIILFVLEEFFVEPVISMLGDGLGLSILFKLGIVLLLKVIE